MPRVARAAEIVDRLAQQESLSREELEELQRYIEEQRRQFRGLRVFLASVSILALLALPVLGLLSLSHLDLAHYGFRWDLLAAALIALLAIIDGAIPSPGLRHAQRVLRATSGIS
jgi:hypothetical protein